MFNAVHMRKLVLGILALVSVQFAFVTYMMVRRPYVELASQPPQATSPAVAVNPDPLVLQDDSDVDVPRNVVPLEKEAPITHSRTRPSRPVNAAANVPRHELVTARPSVRRQSKPAFDAVPSKISAPVGFRNVVIRYNRDPHLSDCEIREVPKAKKRSYIARAAPVLKKPWGWIKAAGSKLN